MSAFEAPAKVEYRKIARSGGFSRHDWHQGSGEMIFAGLSDDDVFAIFQELIAGDRCSVSVCNASEIVLVEQLLRGESSDGEGHGISQITHDFHGLTYLMVRYCEALTMQQLSQLHGTPLRIVVDDTRRPEFDEYPGYFVRAFNEQVALKVLQACCKRHEHIAELWLDGDLSAGGGQNVRPVIDYLLEAVGFTSKKNVLVIDKIYLHSLVTKQAEEYRRMLAPHYNVALGRLPTED